MLEGEVSGQGLKVCQSDLPSGGGAPLGASPRRGSPSSGWDTRPASSPPTSTSWKWWSASEWGMRPATWPPGQQGHRDHQGQHGHRDHQGQQGYQSHQIGCFIVLKPLQLLFIVQRIFWLIKGKRRVALRRRTDLSRVNHEPRWVSHQRGYCRKAT